MLPRRYVFPWRIANNEFHTIKFYLYLLHLMIKPRHTIIKNLHCLLIPRSDEPWMSSCQRDVSERRRSYETTNYRQQSRFLRCLRHGARIYLSVYHSFSQHFRDLEVLIPTWAYVYYFRAFVGGEHGSEYLQSFSTFLQDNYKEERLDRIYLMVKQHMGKTSQVSDTCRHYVHWICSILGIDKVSWSRNYVCMINNLRLLFLRAHSRCVFFFFWLCLRLLLSQQMGCTRLNGSVHTMRMRQHHQLLYST